MPDLHGPLKKEISSFLSLKIDKLLLCTPFFDSIAYCQILDKGDLHQFCSDIVFDCYPCESDKPNFK